MNRKTMEIKQFRKLVGSNKSAGGAKKRNNHEDRLQITCMRYMAHQYPDVICFHPPNGGKRDSREAKKFKDMGAKPGIPDVCIDRAAGGYHGARIELKWGKNGLTNKQRLVLDQLSTEGYFVAVIRSFDQFKEIVDQYLKGNLIK